MRAGIAEAWMTASMDSAAMPSAYFDLLVRELGGPLGEVLRQGTGRPQGDFTPQIGVSQQLVQVDNLNATQPVGWGLRMGSLFDAPAHGPVGFAMLSAPDLNGAFDIARRYGHIRTPFLVLELRRTARETALVTHTRGLDPARRVPLLESTAVSLYNIAVAITGSRSGLTTTFDYPPPNWAGLYGSYLGSVAFGARENALRVAADVASVRSPLADAGVQAAALRALEDLSVPPPKPAARLVAQLEHLLDVDHGRTTLESAAVPARLARSRTGSLTPLAGPPT